MANTDEDSLQQHCNDARQYLARTEKRKNAVVESCFDNRQLLPGNRSKLTQTDEDKALENVQLMDGNEEVLAMDECSSHVGEEGVHATPLFQSGLDVSVRQPEVLPSGEK